MFVKIYLEIDCNDTNSDIGLFSEFFLVELWANLNLPTLTEKHETEISNVP